MNIKQKKNDAGKRKEKDRADRERIARAWGVRLKKLEVMQDADGEKMSRNKLCDKHDLNKYMLHRYIKGIRTPSWDAVEKINAALEAEGL